MGIQLHIPSHIEEIEGSNPSSTAVLAKIEKKKKNNKKIDFFLNKQKRFDVKKLQDKKKKTRLKVNLIQTNLKPYIYDPCIYIDYIQL